MHGFEPSDAVLEMFPRPGEHTLREEDILKTIEEQGSTIAVVIFSGVQYYTGQWFPMPAITKAAKDKVSLSQLVVGQAVHGHSKPGGFHPNNIFSVIQ